MVRAQTCSWVRNWALMPTATHPEVFAEAAVVGQQPSRGDRGGAERH